MRKLGLAAIVFSGFLLVAVGAEAGSYNSSGTYVGTPSAQISALFSQYPNGGAALRAAIAQAVEADPTLADDVVFLASSASASQQNAAGAGLGDALNYYQTLNTPNGIKAAADIQAVVPLGTVTTSAAFAAATGGGGGGGGNGVPGYQNTGAAPGMSNCVSPSRPGSGC